MPEQMTDAEVMANLEPWAQVAWAHIIRCRPRDATDDEMHPYLKIAACLCRSLAEHRRALADVSWHRNALGQRLVELCPEHIQLDVARLLKGMNDA